MGLFNYPILMSSDILIFNAELIPVGSDQKQHIEMTRDIANKFNLTYGSFFNLPEPLIDETTSYLPGLGQIKCQKAIQIILIFSRRKKLQKQINQIKTDSLEPGENLKTQLSINTLNVLPTIKILNKLMHILMKEWVGEILKKNYLNVSIKKYLQQEKNISIWSIIPKKVEKLLEEGEAKALKIASKNLKEIRSLVGIKSYD